jgi:hypothetical protein
MLENAAWEGGIFFEKPGNVGFAGVLRLNDPLDSPIVPPSPRGFQSSEENVR